MEALGYPRCQAYGRGTELLLRVLHTGQLRIIMESSIEKKCSMSELNKAEAAWSSDLK